MTQQPFPFTLANLPAGNNPVSDIDANFAVVVRGPTPTVVGLVPYWDNITGTSVNVGYDTLPAFGTLVKLVGVDGSNKLPAVDGSNLTGVPSGVVRSYLAGLTLSAAGSSSSFGIAVGVAADSANAVMLSLATAYTKTTGAWAVGTGNGSLDIGTIANNLFYFPYLIRRPDTGVVDVLTSLAPGTSATNTITVATPAVVTWTNHGLQAGAPWVPTTTGALPTGLTAGTTYYVIAAGLGTNSFEVAATQGGAAINTTGTQSGTHTGTSTPALPIAYTQFRRIGGLLTDGSAQWVAFIQDGDLFQWLAGVAETPESNPGTSAVSKAVTVPPGVNVLAWVQAILQQGDSSVIAAYLSDLATSDIVPSPSFATLANGQSALLPSATLYVRTNTSRQIRTRVSASNGNTALYINTLGWLDSRGRNA